jgi:plastocyanin
MTHDASPAPGVNGGSRTFVKDRGRETTAATRCLRVGLIACAVLVAAVLPRVTARVLPEDRWTAHTPREVVIVARGMTFYARDGEEPNPTIRLKAGERVRLVLHNEDPGMSHDLRIADWQLHTRVLNGKSMDAVEFTVPKAPGRHAYNCTPHAEMMRGQIEVE